MTFSNSTTQNKRFFLIGKKSSFISLILALIETYPSIKVGGCKEYSLVYKYRRMWFTIGHIYPVRQLHLCSSPNTYVIFEVHHCISSEVVLLGMFKIVHRINTIEQLKKIPPEYGVEVDVRAEGDRVILHHEPFQVGEDFASYLKAYQHAFIVLNIKEAGIEKRMIEMVEGQGIKDYFLLDVEFPYIFKETRPVYVPPDGAVPGKLKIAVRYSEAEPIEQALALKDKVEWVWIDTNTKLPLDTKVVQQLQGFKACLVSPDRWGRPEDIAVYKKKLAELDFKLDAVMVGWKYLGEW